MTIGLEILVILLLIVLNGLFSLSELALVSVRRARLAVLERKGVKGAAAARALSDDPQRFLPTVQVGITLVSVFTGVFGGARIARSSAGLAGDVPARSPLRRKHRAGPRRHRDHLPDAGPRANWCRSSSPCARPNSWPSGSPGRSRSCRASSPRRSGCWANPPTPSCGCSA